LAVPDRLGRFAVAGFCGRDELLLEAVPQSVLRQRVHPTAVLGCIILTGYLGGAVAAYTRMGEPYPILVPLSTAMIAWFGIWLRDERLRRLLPIR
jgi:hypothetical protein